MVILEAFTIVFSLKKVENDILLAIKHVKEVSKIKVTFAKTEQFTKRNKIEISAEELTELLKTWSTMVLYRCKLNIKMQHIIFPNNLKVMILC